MFMRGNSDDKNLKKGKDSSFNFFLRHCESFYLEQSVMRKGLPCQFFIISVMAGSHSK